MTDIASRHVLIDYTNHAGERQQRTIVPDMAGNFFGSSPWHPEEQWLLNAFDVGKGAERTFAMKDIHGWLPADSRSARAERSIAKRLQESIEQNHRMKARFRSESMKRLLHAISDQRVAVSIRANIERILNDSEPV